MERERIISLFEKLYDGHPWIDVTLMPTLEKISAQQAATKVLPDCNSIWEITNHLVNWRENVLQRIQGKIVTTPSNNYIKPITDTSQKAWSKTLEGLESTQKEWVRVLRKFSVEDFGTEYPTNGMTYYEHIHGIVQHDAYHLGQIVLLSKIAFKL